MGNRLTKIYTRTGDEGSTGLGDGQRVPKNHARVEAYGTVDELNCAIGVLLAHNDLPDRVHACFTRIQNELFDLGGELCIPGTEVISESHTKRLEEELDSFNEQLPPLKDFILPGGGSMSAACHMARAIARRAERRVWTLVSEEELSGPSADKPVNQESLRYLNRLSDLLFVVARVLSRHEQGSEVLWRRKRG